MIIELLERRFGRRVGRRLRAAKLVVLLALGVWVGWGVHRRVTLRAPSGPAPRPNLDAYRAVTDRPDVTDELLEVLGYFRNVPVAPGDALAGPWDPANRPELRLVLSFVGKQQTSAALDRLAEASRGSARIPPYDPTARSWYVLARPAAETLVARARRRWVADGDPDGAWSDLLAALQLSRVYQEQPDLTNCLIGHGIETITYDELHALLMEHPPTRGMCDRILADLAKLEMPGVERFPRIYEAQMVVVRGYADTQYARDGSSDGWLDVATWRESTAQVKRPRSTWWNLGAMFFDKPSDIDRRLARLTERHADAAELGPLDAYEAIRDIERQAAPAMQLSGPLPHYFRSLRGAYAEFATIQAFRGAARVGVSLAAWRREHGGYPKTLEELVPGFLPGLPLDPWDGKPIRYQRLPGGYKLYSVSFDGVDDGGQRVVWVKPGIPRRDRVLAASRPALSKPRTKTPGGGVAGSRPATRSG